MTHHGDLCLDSVQGYASTTDIRGDQKTALGHMGLDLTGRQTTQQKKKAEKKKKKKKKKKMHLLSVSPQKSRFICMFCGIMGYEFKEVLSSHDLATSDLDN